jgi:anti-anti-sigma factor
MTAQTVFEFADEMEADTGVMVISLVGKMDPLAAEQVAPAVEAALRSGVRRFVFDMSRLLYVGSLGLRLFVDVSNRVRGQGAVALCRPTPAVLTILDMTKLNRVLRYYPTRHEAVDAVRV